MGCALPLLLCLLPQGESTLAGRVLEAAGKPVATATVTLLHRPIARHPDPATEHRVVVATDARGAFRVPLRAGTPYSVWAATATEASAVAEGIDAGGFLELRLAAGSAPQAVVVTGLDAWPEAASFRYRALVGSENVDFVPVPCRGGALQLPALPPMTNRTLEVLTAEGRILWAGRPEAAAAGATMPMPPPAQYTVQVADAKGAPLRDVEILAHVVNYWATQSPAVPFGDRFRALWPSQGRTDGDGRLALRLPMVPREKPRLWLLACKEGYRMSVDGVLDGRRFQDGNEAADAPADDPARPIAVVLHAAPPATVPLRQPDGSAVAADILFLLARVHVRRPGGGGMGIPFHVPLAVAGGEARLPAPLPSRATSEIAWTTLPPALASTLRERHGFVPSPQLRLPLADQLLADVPPAIDLATWHELQVVAADGRPAAHVVVQLRERVDREGVLVRTDRRGRLLFPLPGDVRASVFAPAGLGSASIAAGRREPTRLALQALAVATGCVVDEQGRPEAGADITVRITAEAHGDHLRHEHALLAMLWPARRSDADGRFELLLPPFPAQIELTATAAGRHAAAVIEWDPAAPAKVEVVLPRP